MNKEAVTPRTWWARPSPTIRTAAPASGKAWWSGCTREFLFKGSHALFLQVIDNLLKNALRSLAAAKSASQPGDILIEVEAGGRGQIIVTDRGVGMDPNLQARIFEPFFSTDRGTGHGLGLAFCQRVIQGAGGSIRVRSEQLHGAIFIIELPVLSQHNE